MSEHTRRWAAVLILILSNASTFPGFGPMIRATKENPNSENWRPWALWAFAYFILLGVTWVDTDSARIPASLNPFTWGLEYWTWLTFMSYPASCGYLHARVSWLARPIAQKRHKEALEQQRRKQALALA